MHYRKHNRLKMFFMFFTFLSTGFGLVIFFLLTAGQMQMGYWAMGAVLVGPVLTEIVFHFLVHAHCEKCSGTLRTINRQPVTYRCDHCGNVYKTKWYEGRRH